MFKVACEGGKLREVRFMERTIQNVLAVVDRLRDFPGFLPSDNPFTPFVDRGTFILEVDDVGLIAFQLHSRGVAFIHVLFWDRRLRGREELLRTVSEWVCHLWQVRLLACVEEKRRASIACAKRVGYEEVERKDGIVVLAFSSPTIYPG